MKKSIALLFMGVSTAALAQSTPNWPQHYVPPASEWSSWWSRKVDVTGGTIDGATIGATTPGPGTFSSLTGGATTYIGNGVTANSNVYIKTPNGSNINIVPQGSAYTYVQSPAFITGLLTLSSNTWSGSSGGALTENSVWTGTSTATGNLTPFNSLLVTDHVDSSSSVGSSVLWVRQNIDSVLKKGNSIGLNVSVNQSAATGNASGGQYVGIGSTVNVTSGDNGTSGSHLSSWTALNPVLQLSSGATYTQGGSGQEIDIGFAAAADVKIGLLIDQLSTDTTQATGDDIGMAFDAQSSGTSKWATGLSFGRSKGNFPIASTGTMIGGQGLSGAGFSVTNGIDWSLGTASGNWLNMGGDFIVSGAGAVTTPTLQSASGSSLVVSGGDASHSTVIKNGPSGNLMMLIGGSNNWVETEATLHLNPTSTPGNQGFNMNNTWTGSSSSAFFSNVLQTVDNTANTSTQGSGTLLISDIVGASSSTGPKNTLIATFGMTHASGNATAPGGSYSAGQFTSNVAINDGGTGLTAANARGLLYAINPVSHLSSGATNWTELTAQENDCSVDSGASALDFVCTQIVSLASHAVAGTRDDVMLSLNAQPGASGVTYGFEFGRAGGAFPISSSGTLIYGQGNLGSGFSVTNGIDWHLGTFSGNTWNDGHVTISGAGTVSAVAYKVGSTAGVSCSAGTVNLTTMVVTNGIVTHC